MRDPHAERVRRLNDKPPRDRGRYVLYWMTTALRVEENPAFERAVLSSIRLNLPLLVHHELSARYADANDRLHRFVLEGEAELAAAVRARGATFSFHLDTRTVESPLRRLCDDAAVVLTDEFPTYDVRRWVERVASRIDVAMLGVDAACVVPMQSVGRAFDRAYAYRESVRERWARGMEPVTPLEPVPGVIEVPDGPPLDDVSALLRRCPIDHTVPPSPALRGGAGAARARLSRFLELGLPGYGERRNDPLDEDGVSGLSPYLHFGMIWAGAVARAVQARGGPDADKFLDELLTWRELAWSFAFHRADHARAIPAWARASLAARPPAMFTPDEDALDRGDTGDRLWDAAQRRLRREGTLHNQVRMTWGKQLVAWLRDPDRALAVAERLNHRYAIDGRDPASYGGILWCLGGFDRPFPETVEMGVVRARPTSVQAKRLDVNAYAKSRRITARSVTVIGAGIAGLSCARVLHDAGVPVQVVDKSPGVGGRMATRRLEGGRIVDHGVPSFRAQTPSFLRWLRGLPADVVRERDGVFELPSGATALAKRLRGEIPVSFDAKVESIERDARFSVHTAQRVFESDAVVVAIPVPQAAALCPSLPSAEYRSEHVIWFDVDAEPFARDLEDDWARHVAVTGGVAVLRARATELDDASLLERARSLFPGLSLSGGTVKRWRYARVERPIGAPFVAIEPDLLVIGDGVLGDGVDAAWASGAAAAADWLNRQL